MLVALSTLAAAQSKGTRATARTAVQLLNYAASHPDAVICFHSSDKLLKIDKDASYLSELEARSRAADVFFCGNDGDCHLPDVPLSPLNGAVHIICNLMWNVMGSAREAEVGATYHNGQDGCMLRTTLIEMGHVQPATPPPNRQRLR
jgi:L-asparaginase II